MLLILSLLLGLGLSVHPAAAQSTNPTGAVGLGVPSPPAAPARTFGSPSGAAVVGGNGSSQVLMMPGGGNAVARSNGNGTTGAFVGVVGR